jgi:hypothetical protein
VHPLVEVDCVLASDDVLKSRASLAASLACMLLDVEIEDELEVVPFSWCLRVPVEQCQFRISVNGEHRDIPCLVNVGGDE